MKASDFILKQIIFKEKILHSAAPDQKTNKELSWDDEKELLLGKSAPIKECKLRLKFFQLTTHRGRTDYGVTNDPNAISTSEDATKTCATRWQIEA